MRIQLLLLACVAVASAWDCSLITIQREFRPCNLGTRLLPLDGMLECKDAICALMNNWEQSKGADTTKIIWKTDTNCEPAEFPTTPVGDSLCTSEYPVQPTPVPTSPPWTPTPGSTGTPVPGGTPPPSKSGGGGISGGAIFLIIFFVGGAVFFAAGMAFQYKVNERRGVEMVPLLGFWKDLPFLVKDGAKFTAVKIGIIKGSGYNNVV